MARLHIRTAGLEERTLDLRLGVNRVGRDPEGEICIIHPTISTLHCELGLTHDGVYVRDCNSTNGTFLNGERVTEVWLDPGQTLRLGDVELLVESTHANIAIPHFERPTHVAPPPVVLPDGMVACSRHDSQPASYKCTHCSEVMCNACIRVMRRKGGVPLFLCVLCSKQVRAHPDRAAKKEKGILRLFAGHGSVEVQAHHQPSEQRLRPQIFPPACRLTTAAPLSGFRQKIKTKIYKFTGSRPFYAGGIESFRNPHRR
ncbi:MAG: FHA domain-containing protein [Limisphaerales bacterium]